nr:hypothetical protein [Tanacetum cinerariifolium]
MPPIYDDDYDYKESTIPLNDIISQEPPSNVITTSPSVLPTEDPDDSLIIRNEELNTIPKKESDEFIKSSVEDLVPIPSESEDTSRSDNEYIVPSDNETLSDEDVLEDNVIIYSNPLFKIDDEYISSDVNPLFDEVLENIESKDSYDSNLDEPNLLVTPLFNDNLLQKQVDLDCVHAVDGLHLHGVRVVQDSFIAVGDTYDLLITNDDDVVLLQPIHIDANVKITESYGH